MTATRSTVKRLVNLQEESENDFVKRPSVSNIKHFRTLAIKNAQVTMDFFGPFPRYGHNQYCLNTEHMQRNIRRIKI